MSNDFQKFYIDKELPKGTPKKGKGKGTKPAKPEFVEKSKCALSFNQKKDCFVLTINITAEIALDNPHLSDFKKVRYNLDNISENIKKLPDL